MAEVATNGKAGANGKALSKRALRRARKKAQKRKLKEEEARIAAKLKRLRETEEAAVEDAKGESSSSAAGNASSSGVVYVESDDLATLSASAPEYAVFREVFAKFRSPADAGSGSGRDGDDTGDTVAMDASDADSDAEGGGDDDESGAMSRKQRRKAGRLTIAELKQLVSRPDAVGLHDANSHDPKLLVALKSYRNTVPVPSHWCQKRKYLQNKRGLERSPFELPKFIADTGIGEVRGVDAAEADNKGLKGISKQRMQPKMGKIDIDYHVLHDAFFRHQVKPKCSSHGDMYYEGKENEVRFSQCAPGRLSDGLLKALGMQSRDEPPPWLFNMQRFGPPPSYPNLKFPGVNSPIPPGASYGFGPGQWGKAPVDAYNRPLFGDVYGMVDKSALEIPMPEAFKEPWGQIEDESEESESESESESDDDGDGEGAMGQPGDTKVQSGIESVSSLPSGMVTPETLQLRKQAGAETPTADEQPKQLYKVLEQKQTTVGSAVFGSSHTYVLPTQASEAERRAREAKRLRQGAVDVTLNPEDLANMDAETLQKKYVQQVNVEAQARKSQREDVSDVIEEETRKRKRSKKKKSKFKF